MPSAPEKGTTNLLEGKSRHGRAVVTPGWPLGTALSTLQVGTESPVGSPWTLLPGEVGTGAEALGRCVHRAVLLVSTAVSSSLAGSGGQAWVSNVALVSLGCVYLPHLCSHVPRGSDEDPWVKTRGRLKPTRQDRAGAASGRPLAGRVTAPAPKGPPGDRLMPTRTGVKAVVTSVPDSHG